MSPIPITEEEVAPKPYSKILAAYDGSEHSKRALMRAATLAKDHDAILIIINAVDMTAIAAAPLSPPVPEEVYNDIISSGKDLASQAVELVKPMVPRVAGVSEQGNAAQTILRMASEHDIDLIVMGRRGLSGIERFLIGGVSSAVVAHSKCDVLIVR